MAREREMDLLNELQSFFEWHPRKNHLYNYAHQHRMTFYHHKTKDDDHFICSACNLPVEYAMYGCPECPTMWLHKLCAELPGEIKEHPFHKQHSLVRYNPETSSDHIRKCSGCDLPFHGAIYGCTECKVFFHKPCLELPPEVKHLRHPSHRLSLKQEWGKFWCSTCSKDHTGLNYPCKRCDYNLGIRCIFEGATKPNGNLQGHILSFFRKQPSEFRDDFCLSCGQRFSSQPIFRCKECRFSLHSQCVLPFNLSLLPPTFQSKSHGSHRLTLTNYFADDFNSFWQRCDVCQEEIYPTFPFYYCKDCDFAADLTCVLEQHGWSLAHKVNYVELDTLPITVENPSLTVKEIIESFTEDEMKELNDVVKAAFGEKVGARKKSIKDQKDEGKENYKAPTYFGQIMEVFESKCGDKQFGLSYYETGSQVTEYNGCTIPKNLEPVLKVLFAVHKNIDISAESKIKSPRGKTFIFMILCAAIYSICTVKKITESQLFTYWDCFKIARTAGFNIEFAMNRLSNAMHAYLGLGDNGSDPFLDTLDEEMKKISTDMDKFQKTRKQRKTSMLLNSKDRLPGFIEIVGKKSWGEYPDGTSESEEEDDDTTDSSGEDDTTDSSEDQLNMTEEVPSEMSEQEEEGTWNGEVPGEMLEEEEGTWNEEISSELLEQEEEGTLKARDESTREILKPEGDAEEDQTSNTREERPSEMSKLEDTWKVGEERSIEMPEPKKDDKKEGEEKSSTIEEMQDESKLPNPWDYSDTCKQTNKGRPAQSGDQVQNSILKKIKDFIEKHPSKSLSYFAQENRPKLNTTDEIICSRCKQPIKDKNQGCTPCCDEVTCSGCEQPIKDRNQGCTSCSDLPRKINCDIHNDTMSLFQGFKKKTKSPSDVQSNSTIATDEQNRNKKAKDEASLCIACELPISDAKNETYHCPKCKIFLHKFCVQFPLQIQHPLHPLHPLQLKIDLERVKKIECNVCGEKCRGCAYYGCNRKECRFDLEVQCLFSQPTVQSRCHGKVFCFQEKRLNQSPRGCFACGKKIIAGSSSPLLRCAPCNVSLHEQCPIPSPIIRSFHPHPLYFTTYCFREDSEDTQCDFCKKKMRSVDPFYFCEVCDDNFHIHCAAENTVPVDSAAKNIC